MTPAPPTRQRGYLIAVIATALWSTTAIFIGYLSTRYRMPPLVLAFWRDLLAAATLGLGLWLIRRPLLWPAGLRRHLPFLVLYGFILAAFNALWITAVALDGAAVGTVLVYSSPALTALLGRRLFGERLGAAKIVAVILSIAGCVLVSGAYDPAAWRVNALGIAVGLLGGAGFAAYNLMGKAAAQRGLPAWTTMFYTFALAAGFLLCFLPFVQPPATLLWLGSSLAGWGVLLLLAAGPTVGGYGLFMLSLTYLPVSVANLIATLEPPMTAGLAFLLLGEKLSALQLAGAGLILLGVVLLRLRESV